MENRVNRIFLIGNGFDLSHGLETSYKSFIIWYLQKCTKNALESGRNKYEDKCISVIVGPNKYAHPFRHQEVYNELADQVSKGNLNILEKDRIVGNLTFRSSSPPKIHDILSFLPQNNFIKKILKECLECDWNGIEDEIYKDIMISHFKLQEFQRQKSTTPIVKETPVYPKILSNIKNLNESVDCLKEHLKEYLLTQNNPDKMNVHIFSKILSSLNGDLLEELNLNDPSNISTTLFLNFNYTTYYKEIVKEIEKKHGSLGNEFKSINIHGNLSSEIDDIVFGIGDEQNNFYNEIESMYHDEWLKCMKSFHYFRNENYQELLGFVAKGEYEIYVMGHSCSITDRTLLNMLFENKYCKKIKVFHYKGMDSYLRTAYNVARNFNNKVKMREVLMPFDPDLKM